MMTDVIDRLLSCHRALALPDLEDDSSPNRPISHGAHRFPGLFQGKDAIDVGANLPLGQQLRQGVVRARSLLRKFLCPGAGKDTNNGIVLQKQEVHGHRRNLAARETDRHQPSAPLLNRAICSKIVPPTLSKQTSTPSPPVVALIRSRRSSLR